MPSHPPTPTADPEDRYHGFSLASVGWGHRALFEQVIEGFLERGLIGPSRRQVTATFFRLLRQADQGCYDHVLRRFLGAINPRTEWLLDLPDLFAEVVELGRDLAATQPHRGVVYFETLAAGGLGQTPAAVTQAVVLARRLCHRDPDLAVALLRGYGRLVARLQPHDVERFVAAGSAAFGCQPRAGLAFMEGASESADALVRDLAQECCLEDIRVSLRGVLAALAGRPVALAELAALPAAALAARSPSCLCFADTLYLPARLRRCNHRDGSRSWYTLAAATAAGSLRFGGFSHVHGHRGYPSLAVLAADDKPLSLNALMLAEWRRVLACSARAWPGLGRLQRFWLEQDLAASMPRLPDALRRLLLGGDLPSALARLASLAEGPGNVVQLAAALDASLLADLQAQCPELGQGLLPPLSFMPDALFPARPATPPEDSVVVDLLRAAAGPGSSQDAAQVRLARAATRTAPPGAPEAEDQAPEAAFLYDEWSRDEHDYRRDYCHVHEVIPEARGSSSLPPELAAESGRIRRAFERAKPDTVRRERYLRDGDEINADRLVHFLMERGADPSPRVDFYEKPRIARRDLAVLILLDVSGSAAEPTPDGPCILDLERHAALVLGQGLDALGDPFAVCGFHSAGPRDCTFLVFKDFGERWEQAAMARLAGAVPARNTRIGPALRHAGWRLAQVPCRQRLILLVTDGRPLDSDYDPATHYAHSDVRKACEENAARGVRTFGVCTDPRRGPDMGLMFPGRRFVILPDIGQLARALPTLYSRLTL